jgi:hypothetical protein
MPQQTTSSTAEARNQSARACAIQAIGDLVEHLAELEELLQSSRPLSGSLLGGLMQHLAAAERDLRWDLARVLG